MKRILLLWLLLLPVSLYAQTDEIKVAPGARCSECGMYCLLDSPFTSVMINTTGQRFWYCDVGDLFISQKDAGKGSEQGQRYVRDFHSNEWLKVESAFFVKSSSLNSPMGWGIAAFNTNKTAAEYGKVLSAHEVMGLLP